MHSEKYTSEYIEYLSEKMKQLRETEPHAKDKETRDILMSVEQSCWIMEVLRSNIVAMDNEHLEEIEKSFEVIDFLVELVETYNEKEPELTFH